MTTQTKTEESKLAALESHISERVAEGVEALRVDIESKVEQRFSQMPAVHTESRTSEWTEGNYELGKGQAFREGLSVLARAWQAERSFLNAASYANDKEFAKRFLMEERAVGNAGQGGANLVPEILAEDVIPELYKRLALNAAGVTMIPMNHKKLPIGRQNQKSIATHVGESSEIPENGPEFTQLELDAKKVTGRADVANDWLRSDPRGAMNFIAADLLKAVAVAMDTQALEGTGSATAPAGIFSQIDAANKFLYSANAGKVDGTLIEANLDAVEKAVLDANISPGDIAVIMGDRDFLALRRRRDSGVLVFEGLRETTPTLTGKRVYRTNTILENRNDSAHATGGDESRIYMGDWSSVLFGILRTMELAFSEHQRFTFDEVIVRLVAHYDVKLRRTKDLAVLSTDFSA